MTLCNPMDYSPPDSSVHGPLQARILEWVAISFSRSSPPRDQTHNSCIGRQILHHSAIREASAGPTETCFEPGNKQFSACRGPVHRLEIQASQAESSQVQQDGQAVCTSSNGEGPPPDPGSPGATHPSATCLVKVPVSEPLCPQLKNRTGTPSPESWGELNWTPMIRNHLAQVSPPNVGAHHPAPQDGDGVMHQTPSS